MTFATELTSFSRCTHLYVHLYAAYKRTTWNHQLILDLFKARVTFLLCTLVNHHQTTMLGEYCLLVSSILNANPSNSTVKMCYYFQPWNLTTDYNHIFPDHPSCLLMYVICVGFLDDPFPQNHIRKSKYLKWESSTEKGKVHLDVRLEVSKWSVNRL